MPMLKPRQRNVAVAIAIPGIVACASALAIFVWKIFDNRLPWHARQTAREHYIAVGNAYTDGFATGLFLCFFLMVLAAAVVAWFEHRRGAGRLASPDLTAGPGRG